MRPWRWLATAICATPPAGCTAVACWPGSGDGEMCAASLWWLWVPAILGVLFGIMWLLDWLWYHP